MTKKYIRLDIYNKCSGHCAYCGMKITYKNMQLDHILPKYRGGDERVENYLPSCRSCNSTKATYTVEEFRQRLLDDVKRLHRDSAKFRILTRFGIIKQAKTKLSFYFECPNLGS